MADSFHFFEKRRTGSRRNDCARRIRRCVDVFRYCPPDGVQFFRATVQAIGGFALRCSNLLLFVRVLTLLLRIGVYSRRDLVLCFGGLMLGFCEVEAVLSRFQNSVDSRFLRVFYIGHSSTHRLTVERCQIAKRPELASDPN